MRGGVRQNAADTKSDPVNEDETTSTTASEMLALAEEAEAEAAEAEALAAAARARARAIKLRRDAEALEAAKQRAAQESVSAEAESVSEEAETDPADSVQTEVTEVPDTPEIEPDDTESADKPENLESEVKTEDGTEESPDDAAEEPEATIFSADATKRARRWRRRLGRPRRSTVAAGLAIIVIAATLVLSGYMVKEHRDASQRRERAAEFVAAARQGVVTLTSLDFNDAKGAVQRIMDNSTGTFKDDFLKMADDFVKVVEQSKVVERSTVQAAAVDLDTMTANSAVVLVACTSEVTNAAGAKQDPRTYRLIVTMTRDGGQLKMSKVEFVP